MKVLVVPGYTGSGPQHWQTWLESRYESIERVEQRDWETVDRETWIQVLDEHIGSTNEDLFLLGHSCGSIAIAQWAISRPVPPRVRGAILVAPADVDSEVLPAPTLAQRPVPSERLPLAHTIVASTDDPFLSNERAVQLAARWGAKDLIWIPDAGHLSSADGYGRWPLVADLLATNVGPLTRRTSFDD